MAHCITYNTYPSIHQHEAERATPKQRMCVVFERDGIASDAEPEPNEHQTEWRFEEPLRTMITTRGFHVGH